MFPRHLQSVGSRCIARAGHSHFSCRSIDFYRCPWWPAYYPQTFYQPVISSWHPRQHWRPYPCVSYQRPPLQNCPPPPWIPGRSSWIHTSHFNMDSKKEELLRKRRRSAEGGDCGRGRSWSKRSYPPASDFSVPPAQNAARLAVPSAFQPDLRATVKRKWEDFSYRYSGQSSGCQASEKFDFSVMSYNILSQALLEDNWSLYSHCQRPHLFWHYRLPNILRELEEMNADILCLQEVQENHYEEEIRPSLEALGYCCQFKARTGRKPDGCAICFKSEKFSLLLVTPVEYFRKNISVLDRDNIGLVLTLQPKTGRETPVLCVATTHLLYNPRRGDVKLAQLAILLAEITKVSQLQDGSFCPIILCGDFNCVPGSPLHRFIKEGRLNYGGMTIGKVSGQEESHRGQRILSIPIWPKSLGITQKCVYEPSEHPEKKEKILEEEPVKKTDKSIQEEEPVKKTDESIQEEAVKTTDKSIQEEEPVKKTDKSIQEEEPVKKTDESIQEEAVKKTDKSIQEEEPVKKTDKSIQEEVVIKTEQKEESNKEEDSNLQHHFCLSSVYSHFFPDTGVPEITTCHSRSAVTVDYIFYSPARMDIFSRPEASVPCTGLQLLGRLSLLTEQDLWSVNGLPNETNSSDHLSLLSLFRLAV